MRADSLILHNVRNHTSKSIDGLAPGINVFAGPNGIGKTSVLEALALATLTKSFVTHSDTLLIRDGEQKLEVEAHFITDLGVNYTVEVKIEFGPPVRKTILANAERIRASSDLIGRAPVVVLTPDEKIITSGPPAERRRFLNMVLSQASHAYLEDEIEYRRALKQRNAVLTDAKLQRRPAQMVQAALLPWTAIALERGERIMRRRAEFVREFRGPLLDSYRTLASTNESPSLDYLPMGNSSEAPDFRAFLERASEQCAAEELRRGTTLFGPHRDDIRLSINPGQEAKDYASQGQHKTLLVAMKLAEFQYLRDATRETPMLLFDDVFSELDDERARAVLALAASGALGQTFITTTEVARFERELYTTEGTNRLIIFARS
ncbi:MAG: DNA replication and repair protein RecF [Bacteroidota bacterium]|nr:DNA replication and repair protein RecF [Bacteroidota bacterium]MDP4234308.1 DNA replication and repair protein RecF [Bacteroidota bacterium]MDP4243242.1 DNA replication and repair protein RecF [Bacteroidota bacterium]MDP4288051.1 DNA replication and repair protein RecF [Bacteroidota bacterium]